MQTVETILNQLGGYATVAAETEIPATTVHSWQRSNFIPAWRRPTLISLAEKKHVELSGADFPARESAAV